MAGTRRPYYANIYFVHVFQNIQNVTKVIFETLSPLKRTNIILPIPSVFKNNTKKNLNKVVASDRNK